MVAGSRGALCGSRYLSNIRHGLSVFPTVRTVQACRSIEVRRDQDRIDAGTGRRSVARDLSCTPAGFSDIGSARLAYEAALGRSSGVTISQSRMELLAVVHGFDKGPPTVLGAWRKLDSCFR
jgi:hypothetical protein